MASNPVEQIPLALPVEVAQAREDLVVTPANRMAIELVDNWPAWPGQVTILAGPVGSGKTHIGAIWTKMASAQKLTGNDLQALEIGSLAGLNLLIEDLTPQTLQSEDVQKTLFHLINLARQNATHMLITSNVWPQSWGVTLPDLASRLRAAQLVELHEPDDALLQAVIVKLFADRQLQVDLAVVDYLVVRMERSLEAANRVVQWMDHHSLVRSKRITRNLAADALKALETTDT